MFLLRSVPSTLAPAAGARCVGCFINLQLFGGVLLIIGASCGCTNTDGLGRVYGRVTVDGLPAPEGIVIEFAPVVAREVGESFATVGSDGQYVAINPATGSHGVAIGLCVARLLENELTTTIPERRGLQPKPKYDAQQFKELARFEVKAGSNTVDLELTPVAN